MNKNAPIYLLLSLIWLQNSKINSDIIYNGCPTYCSCSFLLNVQEIKCTQAQTNGAFFLPDVSINPTLVNSLGVTITNSYLLNIPSNLCQLAQSLRILDLSSNLINQGLESITFSCLYNLEFLVLKNNSITSISENTFNNLRNLRFLDLSRNKIRTIPLLTFPNKLPNLSTLILSNNLITKLDFWFLYMTSLNYLDLSYNQISQFTNEIKWNPYILSLNTGYSQVISNAELFDLSYNSISKLDDDVLLLYSICNIFEFRYFVRLLNKMQLTGNPLDCSCIKSYNLLTFYQNFTISDSAQSSIGFRIFGSSCSTPDSLKGLSAFTFVNPSTCSSLSKPFSAQYCSNTTQSVTTVSSTLRAFDNNVLNTPQLLLNGDPDQVTGNDYFNYKLTEAQIVGIVIGFLGALLLIIILFYCMCPIEILALIFGCVPYFFKICPCKSGVKRDKEYDLFISYNKVSENWVRHNLIPFIKENYFVDNYILHYNEANRENEIFGPYIKDIMSKSSCILFILSDQFLMKEWNNRHLREHLRYLVTKEKTRFLTIQMHDVSDEEVEEYFRQKLQLPSFVSLENDEFLFWTKLGYFLYTNDKDEYEKVMPIQKWKESKKQYQHNQKYQRHESVDSNASEIPGYNFYKLPIMTYKGSQNQTKNSGSYAKVKYHGQKNNGFLLDEVNDDYSSSKSKKIIQENEYNYAVRDEATKKDKKHKKNHHSTSDKINDMNEVKVLKVHVEKPSKTEDQNNLRVHVDTINQNSKNKNALLKVDFNKHKDSRNSNRRNGSESRSVSQTRGSSKTRRNSKDNLTEDSTESMNKYY